MHHSVYFHPRDHLRAVLAKPRAAHNVQSPGAKLFLAVFRMPNYIPARAFLRELTPSSFTPQHSRLSAPPFTPLYSTKRNALD